MKKLFFLATGLAATLINAITAEALPSYSDCSGCHSANSAVIVTANLTGYTGSNANYTVSVSNTNAGQEGWAVFNGAKLAAGFSPGVFSVPAGSNYTVYGISGKNSIAGLKSIQISPPLQPPPPPPPPPPPSTDNEAPKVISFDLPLDSSTLSVSVLALSAMDNVKVTGFKLTETAAKPLAGDLGWSAGAPGSFTFSAAGTRTLYAWAKDAAGNVSNAVSDSVIIALAPPPAPAPAPATPGEGALLFSDSFADASASGDPDWIIMEGTFGGANGVFAALGRRDNLALVEGIAGLDPFAGGRIETKVRVGSADSKLGVEIIFDYQDAENHRSVRLDRNRKRLVVGQVGNFGEAADKKDEGDEGDEAQDAVPAACRSARNSRRFSPTVINGTTCGST